MGFDCIVLVDQARCPSKCSRCKNNEEYYSESHEHTFGSDFN